ncbi:MAG TPA: proline dehydrogenase, partial [Candidatus Polarisedimenticolia bacterium]|nr:proline dehydrogenase [Candidatus Polarisedimenticolia bacterium]
QDESPQEVAAACAAAAGAMGGGGGDYLSLKAPALDFDLRLVRTVAEAARRRGTGLHFDSHGPEQADATFALLAAAARTGLRIGCTLPSRWRRSAADAEAALAMGVPVRLVKGQWPDPSHRGDPRRGYLDLADRLAGRAPRVFVATHDEALGREALRRLREAGTPCTLELLYGLPARACRRAARRAGVGVRVYVPFGRGWLPYAAAQAASRPWILWWLARDLVRGALPRRAGAG